MTLQLLIWRHVYLLVSVLCMDGYYHGDLLPNTNFDLSALDILKGIPEDPTLDVRPRHAHHFCSHAVM